MQWLFLVSLMVGAPPAEHTAELVFPVVNAYSHAPGIVECPNGDLLVSWYESARDRMDRNVKIMGSRKAKGDDKWSEPFLLGDTPNFPDWDTCMIIDGKQQLWLFYSTIVGNDWGLCITNFKVTKNFEAPGAPVWDREGIVLVRPDDFGDEAQDNFQESMAEVFREISDAEQEKYQQIAARFTDKLYQRLSWQVRCKPVILPSGRLVLPLYSDALAMSIMAFTDDDGHTWTPGKPIFGYGAIQPSVVRRNDGTLVAFMRDNSLRRKIRFSESFDDGLSWGSVNATDLTNPNAALDAHRLANGHWLLVHNDTERQRNRLAVSLSTDEGQTWEHHRHLEDEISGSYHYPAVTQGADGTIHVVYGIFVEHPVRGASMKHAAFNEEWVLTGDLR